MDTDFNYSSTLPHSESLMKRYLKKDAVPSVFQFPSHAQKREILKRDNLRPSIEKLYLMYLHERLLD